MRALLVLYYWPPSGGPGVQRGVKLCRHLREHGIEPAVLTVEPDTYALPGEYQPDPGLVSDVPHDLRVFRTRADAGRALRERLVRARLFRAAQHAFPARFFERQAGWFASLERGLAKAVDEWRPDVVLTSSQPYVVHLAGRAERRRSGVPWVADFRDPWTRSWGREWPSERALRWEERREEDVLGDADVVIANTPGTRADWLQTHRWLEPSRVVVARNGYDEDDFRAAIASPAAREPGEFRIVHAGSFRARPPSRARTGWRARLDRAGPEPVPYDDSTHSPAPLFRALAALGDRVANVRVRLVGSVDEGWLALARELGLGDRVRATGYVRHAESVAELLGADLLWLPTITRRDGGPVANVPAKTYEYLGSGRPVLAWGGPGDVRDLLEGRARCRFVDAGGDPAAGLADALADALRAGDSLALPPDPPDARAFRRRETARAVAEALRAACSAPQNPAGSP